MNRYVLTETFSGLRLDKKPDGWLTDYLEVVIRDAGIIRRDMEIYQLTKEREALQSKIANLEQELAKYRQNS